MSKGGSRNSAPTSHRVNFGKTLSYFYVFTRTLTRIFEKSNGKKPSSSQDLVLDQDDLLTLILLRLPYRKLMSLKCVSKKWQSLITNPHFTRLLHHAFSPLRASALLMQRKPFLRDPGEVYFVSLDDRNAPYPFRPHNSQKIRILQSCNGLLLCSNIIPNSSEHNCCLYNLCTNNLATLPKHPLGHGSVGYMRGGFGFDKNYFGLIYDPSKSVNYKVITFFSTPQSNSIDDLLIYSSETGTWKASIQSFTRDPGMIFRDSVYWNGCIHWLSVSDCFYFDVDNERLQTFPRPPIVVSMERRSLYFGESEDHLHVIDYCLDDTSFVVYEMKSDYSEWFLKYQIEIDPIFKVVSEMTEHKNYGPVAVLSLIRREKFQEDSFLVLELPGKVISYNLVDRSVKLIWDFGVTLNIKNFEYWVPGRWKVSSVQSYS